MESYNKDSPSVDNDTSFSKKITVNEKLPYPTSHSVHIPIINTKNHEIVLIYIPIDEIDNFQQFVNIQAFNDVLEDTKILPQLIEYIKDYLRRSFEYNIEKRLKYSYENMKHILPSISLVLYIPEEYKERPIIKEYLKMFKDIRQDVKGHLNAETILTNPFSLAKKNDFRLLGKNVHKKNERILHKWGLSFGTAEELTKKEDEEYKIIQAENKNKQHKEKEALSYKKILHEFMISQYQDFRKHILIECIEKCENFGDYDFESFVFFIETFTFLFSGIQCKYFIDEIGCLNMDFYSHEENLMNLAEVMHYQLQFKIMNKAKIVKYNDKENKKTLTDIAIELMDEENNDITQVLLEKKDKVMLLDDSLEKLNNIQFEDTDHNDVTMFPPFSNFLKKNAHFFRRYNNNDDFHLCEECRYLKKGEDAVHLKCSSVFREIDRIRIIYITLNSLMRIPMIKQPPKDLKYISSVFKMDLIMHDYDELSHLTNYFELVKSYLVPISLPSATNLNKIFRDKFGEDVGFYFFWVSFYINWLVFPASLGLIFFLLEKIISLVTNSTIFLYFNLIFAFLVMLWANMYLNNWKSREKFYAYIWGMENFKLTKINEINDIPVDKWNFMGIKMPILSFSSVFYRKLFSAFIIILSLAFTIFFNLLLFYVENAQLYADNDTIGNGELKMISNGYWLYITPVCTFLIREWMSSLYKDTAIRLTNKEYHIHKDDYNSSLKIKIIFFEFFNYYFNLYYIAFFKKYVDSCPNNDCYALLGNQLTGILTSAIVVNITQVFWNAVYKRNKTKAFENVIKENNPNAQNKSSKFIYYTRTEYEQQDASGEYLEIVMNFGYIIQFGACSPISFFIALCQTIFLRFVDAIKFSRLQYCRLISEAHGIGVFFKVQKLMTFLGLISNICIIFFTDTHLVNVGFGKKILFLFLIENFIIIIMMIVGQKHLPLWYQYKEKIEAAFLQRYTYNSDQNLLLKEKLEEQEDFEKDNIK